MTIRGALVQIGPHAIDRSAWDWRATEENPFWCPDAAAALRWADYVDAVRKAGSSAGAVIEVVASGVPAGLGEPVYDKLDGDLARALMTINAVKGTEVVMPKRKTFYGSTEIGIKDPAGHFVTFAEFAAPTQH